jgi:hypothetical protein
MLLENARVAIRFGAVGRIEVVSFGERRECEIREHRSEALGHQSVIRLPAFPAEDEEHGRPEGTHAVRWVGMCLHRAGDRGRAPRA